MESGFSIFRGRFRPESPLWARWAQRGERRNIYCRTIGVPLRSNQCRRNSNAYTIDRMRTEWWFSRSAPSRTPRTCHDQWRARLSMRSHSFRCWSLCGRWRRTCRRRRMCRTSTCFAGFRRRTWWVGSLFFLKYSVIKEKTSNVQKLIWWRNFL